VATVTKNMSSRKKSTAFKVNQVFLLWLSLFRLLADISQL